MYKDNISINNKMAQQIIENAYDGLLITDDNYKIVYANEPLRRLLGYSGEQIIHNDLRTFENGRLKNIVNYYKKIQKQEEVSPHNEIQIITKTGEIQDIEVHIITTENKNKQRLIVWQFIDITKHKRKTIETVKSDSEDVYRDIFNNVSEYIFTHDLDGHFIDTNIHLRKNTQYSKSELKNKKIRDMVPEEYKLEFDEYLKRIKVNGYEKGLLNVLAKDGHTIVIEYTNSLIQGKDGPIGVRGVARDITEEFKTRKALKKSEEELRIARDELEKRVQDRTKELSESNEKLEEKTIDFEEANIALRILLKKKDETQKEVEERMLVNVRDLILPMLNKMRLSKLTATQEGYADVIESNLNHIITPFALNLSSKYHKLTPAEIQIANLVREGKTTKEIADLLHLAKSTIHTHRDNIRIKLQIKNQKLNLRAHLMSLQK